MLCLLCWINHYLYTSLYIHKVIDLIFIALLATAIALPWVSRQNVKIINKINEKILRSEKRVSERRKTKIALSEI